MTESFLAALNKLAVHTERFLTRQAAQQPIFEYIECYYNRVRKDSTNGWVSLVFFEKAYYQIIEGIAG